MLVLRLLVLVYLVTGCQPDVNHSKAVALEETIQRASAPQKTPLDEGLKRLIRAYDKRWGSSSLYCLEYETIAYDSLQMVLYPAGEFVPIVDFCRPNTYAEFDNKLILIATGLELITPGTYYRDAYRDAFYRIITKKVLGRACSPAQYDSLGLTYGNYDPFVWRIVLSTHNRQNHKVYSVMDSFATRLRNQPPSSIILTPPPTRPRSSR